MKKSIIVFFLALIFFSFAANALAADLRTGCPTEGLVPCGNVTTCPCTLCDLFVLLNNIVQLLLFRIVPILAALLIAIGGVMMIMSYSNGGTENLTKAKGLFKSVIVGLLIIYCAWLIVNLFLWAMGITKVTGEWKDGPGGWWKIECGTSSAPQTQTQSQNPPKTEDFIQYQPEEGYDYTADYNYKEPITEDSYWDDLSEEQRKTYVDTESKRTAQNGLMQYASWGTSKDEKSIFVVLNDGSGYYELSPEEFNGMVVYIKEGSKIITEKNAQKSKTEVEIQIKNDAAINYLADDYITHVAQKQKIGMNEFDIDETNGVRSDYTQYVPK